jgi:hypothetical protein
MRKVPISLLLVISSVAFASSCPDLDLRVAKIGGDVIRGGVVLKHKSLKRVSVRLYFGGSLVWRGVTDSDGRFEVNQLRHGKYRLVVSGWGSADVELKPELDMAGFQQRPYYNLLLSDKECISAIEVVN